MIQGGGWNVCQNREMPAIAAAWKQKKARFSVEPKKDARRPFLSCRAKKCARKRLGMIHSIPATNVARPTVVPQSIHRKSGNAHRVHVAVRQEVPKRPTDCCCCCCYWQRASLVFQDDGVSKDERLAVDG